MFHVPLIRIRCVLLRDNGGLSISVLTSKSHDHVFFNSVYVVHATKCKYDVLILPSMLDASP